MEATTAPALDPATRGNSYPAAASACTAPTKPMPRTPPPSHTRSALAVAFILQASTNVVTRHAFSTELPAYDRAPVLGCHSATVDVGRARDEPALLHRG